jgi:hypothetical protein
MIKNYTVAILLLLLPFFGFTQYRIDSNSKFKEVSLHNYARIYNANDAELTVSQAAQLPDFYFTNLPNENTDIGFTCSNYWIKFQIQNDSNEEVFYYLETSRPIVDVAIFYKISASGNITKQNSGDCIPFEERTLQQRKTVFNLILNPKEKATFLINIKSDGEVINAPVILRSADNLIEVISFEQIVFGFFYGILLIASILYFFFYFAMKERVFLYYSIYVVFIGLLQFSLDGYFYEFIAPQSGWFSQKAVLIFAVVSGFFLAKYSKTFLKVGKEFKFLHLFYRFLYLCFAGLMLVILFIPQWFLTVIRPNLIGLLLLFRL